MAINLSSIQKNGTMKPPRIVIHGPPGIGKSTFAAGAPSPIFLPTEDGLGQLSAHVDAFPLLTSYTEVLEAIETLYTEDHPYKTAVIDSADWLEPLIWSHVCNTWTAKDGDLKRLATIEDAGYGKGYVEACSYWRQLLAGLNALRDKGIMIIITAHSQKVKVEDPMLPTYDSYDLKLHKKASGIISEYADIILFVKMKIVTTTTKDKRTQQERTRAITQDERIMHTVGQASFLAKNRYSLPETLPLSWDVFSQHLFGNE